MWDLVVQHVLVNVGVNVNCDTKAIEGMKGVSIDYAYLFRRILSVAFLPVEWMRRARRVFAVGRSRVGCRRI